MNSEFKKLAKYLHEKHPENYIIPTVHKNPKYRHKNDKWSWKSVDNHLKEFAAGKNGAILLKTLIALDFDDPNLAKKYLTKFPILATCPQVKTKNGMHFYFKRTPECDIACLYDHSRCFGNDKDKIDFKTLCSTGTAGVAVVPPSKGKTWEKPIWNTIIPEFSGEIFDYFVDNWANRKYKNSPENWKGDHATKVVDNTIGDQHFDKVDLSPDVLAEITTYIHKLSEKRATNYGTWIEVAWCLRNISAGYNCDEEFLNLWLIFSQKCAHKFMLNESTRIWKISVPRTNGFNFNNLKKWVRQDNPENLDFGCLHGDDQEVIKSFISNKFEMSKKKIGEMTFKDYDGGKYIFVNILDTFCKIVHDDHDKFENYIVVGSNILFQKCRLCDQKYSNNIKSDDYSQDLKEIVTRLLITEIKPEEALSKFTQTIEDPNIKKMEHEFLPSIENTLGTIFPFKSSNDCPIHDTPVLGCNKCNNYGVINNGKFSIVCNGDMLNPYPANGISVPIDKLQIIINNNITNNQQNNYYNRNESSDVLILQDYESDNLPFYQDDPDTHELLLESFAGKHNDIARFVYKLYGNEFRYIPKDWYKFRNHIWSKLDVPILRNNLSDDVCQIYKNVLLHYKSNAELQNAESKIKLLDSLISNLKISHFKNSVMEECREIFMVSNEEFNESINQANLLPFNNGVLELDSLCFRPGRSTDNMIFSTNIEFVAYDSAENSIMKDILDFLSNILPDPDVREYFLKICAMCMTKNTQMQKIWILTGKGSNGKSLVMGLLKETLGNFSSTINPEILTRKAERVNESNDALSKMEFIRHMIISEPGDDDVLYAEKIKKFTGGRDRISVRGLFREQKDYLPEFKCLLLCNTVPKLSADNYSIWRRIRLIDFPAQFCENPDPDNPLEKKIDETIEDKFGLWAPYFAGYLVHWLHVIQDSGGFSRIIEPDAVKARTQQYREETDIYKEFVDANLIREDNFHLEWSKIKNRLYDWLDNKDAKSRNSVKSKTAPEMQQALTKYLGKWHATRFNYQNFYGYIGWNLTPLNSDLN